MREFVAVFGLVLMLLLTNLVPDAQARPVHFFDCKDCHTASVDLFALGNTNLCLKCHKDTPLAVTYNDLSPGNKAKGLFHPNEASDAVGSATSAGQAPTQQTSHFWAAKKDAVPAAGALAPSKTLYTSRYGISTGKVTCTRCHDPHLPITTDPKLLRMTAAGDLICLDCHRPWKLSNNRGRETHPIVANYAAVATANPTRYKASVTNVGSGGVQLVGGGVSCSSCHGVHFADSHSGTIDGRNNRSGLQPGDGKLLRSDGPKRTGGTAATTAQLRSNLCQACHTYKTHGSNNPIGCLDCHSGHSYNNGDPNFFVLRANISNVWMPKKTELDKTGSVSGAAFKAVDAAWMNAGGTGYCQSCHDLGANHNGFTAGNGIATSCGECHYHGHTDRSFTASCNGCHGTPPSSASPAPAVGGYAKSGSNDYSAKSFYKNELNSPHGSHAGGTDYRFACDVCHLGKSHATGTFQDVFITPQTLASGTARTTPAYDKIGGTCSAVYCHSNGGARGAVPVAATIPAWDNGRNTISGCIACHGNDSTSMTTRGNSLSHQKHLAKGYSCSVCHANTASSASALVAAGVLGSTHLHVNGSADVSYDNSFELSVGRTLGTGNYATDGTCGVYCHSNGDGTALGRSTPDWDVPASGACGTCHGGRVSDVAVISSLSHTKHVSALNGPQLGCDACHGVGSATGAHASHVNGSIDDPAAGVCNSCHSGNNPTWGETVGCGDCHLGASDVDDFIYAGGSPVTAKISTGEWSFSGHGKTSGSYEVTLRAAANLPGAAGTRDPCLYCHDGSLGHNEANYFRLRDNGLGDLNGACLGCHASGSAGVNPGTGYTLKNSIAKVDKYHGGAKHNGTDRDGGRWCWDCHDPHGDASGSGQRIQMIQRRPAINPNANGVPASLAGTDVIFTNRSLGVGVGALAMNASPFAQGICNSCHTTTAQYTQMAGAGSHPTGQCTVCHKHTDGAVYNGEAFKGSGCSGCHGDAATDRYWPDGSGAHPDDNAGRHLKHIQVVAAALGYDYTTANDAQQKAMCAYCHDGPGVTNHANGTVNVGSMKKLWSWDASPDNGVFDATADGNKGTCATTDCHNNKTTPAGYSWHGTNTSNCVMCHKDVPSDTKTHTLHTGAIWGIPCSACHKGAPTWVNASPATQTAPSTEHIDGYFKIEGGSRTFAYSGGSCGTNACHNDGNMGNPDVAYNWTAGNTAGFCAACHGVPADSNLHIQHLVANTTFGGAAIWCDSCHIHSAAKGTGHMNGAVDFKAGIAYSGDAAIADRNNPGIEGNEYGQCTTTQCHSNGLGVAVETPMWNRAAQAGDDCSLCHLAVPSSNAHNEHLSNGYTAAGCADCHTAVTSANHFNGNVNFDGAKASYSRGATVAAGGTPSGTCATASCHNRGTPVTASAAWNTAGDLACDACHYYSLTPTGAANNASAMKLTASHSDHFTAGKTCVMCHGTAPTTTAHISATSKGGGLVGGTNAAQNNSTVNMATASAVYTLAADNSCYSASNNGLGCHATAGAAGAADATRLIWSNTANTLNLATECVKCHTNTTNTAVNPTSGLHGVTPSVSAKIHNQTLNASGCAACHTTLAAQATHLNGTFTGGNGQKTQMGLPAFYTQTADNTGSCATTACHMGFSDDWAHKWNSTATFYTNATTACTGCHGDWANSWNAGIIHRTSANVQTLHGGAGTYKCLDCHTLGTANYPFTFGTADWAPLNSGNKHGNGSIEVNNNGVSYNATSGLCTTCHLVSDGVHDFVDTSWTIANLSGSPITVACGACHTAGVRTTSASGAHSKHGAGTAALVAGGASCTGCHGNNGGLGYQSTLAGTHGTGSVTFAVTYSQAASRGNLTGSCSNASCHYSQATPAWNATYPASPGKCTKCHNSGSDSGTIVGAWPSKNRNGSARSDAHSGHMTTSMITLGANCTDCHGNNTVTHSNAFDASAVVGGAKLSAYSSAAGTCTNSCHGGTAGADFRDKAPTVVCLDCHAGSYIGNFVTTASSHVDADGAAGAYTSSNCEACHGTASNAYKTAHADNTTGVNDVEIPTTYGASIPVPTMNRQYNSTFSKIRLGGTATSGYAKSTEAELCWACHDGVTSSLYTFSGASVTFTNTSATVGTIAATGIGSKFPVGRWITINGSTQAANNRTFKVATSTANSITVTIPTGAGPLVTATNASGVSIVSPISEWQVNESTATGSISYDYGMLYTDSATRFGTRTSNWTSGFWRSGKGLYGGTAGDGAYNPFWYKRAAIQSTHAANFGGTFTAALTGAPNALGFAGTRVETKDAVANIRCSYCHDVHGTHNGINGDPAGGKPFLRGTWLGNPYPEDGAPQWGMANWTTDTPTGNTAGRVPRASAASNSTGLTTVPNAGGYWIDQNSGNPVALHANTTFRTATGNAGLCDQCHGSVAKDGTWTSAEIGAIDQVTSENLWVSGSNGHANVVIGGAGRGANASAESYARNIYTRAKRGSNQVVIGNSNKTNVDMGLATEASGNRGYSYRANDTGYFWYPRIATTSTSAAGTSQPYTHRYFVWGGASYQTATPGSAIATGSVALQVADTTGKLSSNVNEVANYDSQANYHTFSCSKCHNPHASRLPKLMITNCLDTNHNTWEDLNTYTGTGLPTTPWTGLRHSQWGAAQNCHRLDARAVLSTGQVDTVGKGWNKVTPWLEDTAPNTTKASNPNP